MRRIKHRKNAIKFPLIPTSAAQAPYLLPHFRHPWWSSTKGEGVHRYIVPMLQRGNDEGTTFTNYKHVGGLGSPASLQAYFNGPSGNNLCK